jgi:hypothetical protein
MSASKPPCTATAYKFGVIPDSVSQRGSLFKKDKDIAEYLRVLQENDTKWVQTYYQHDGAGVVGNNNEPRELS